MITKGIIKSIDYNGNTCTVRVPFFETANNDEIISTAPISNTPGSYNGYKVDDVVWVAFEDGSMDNPVVIGKLYLGVEAEKADPRGTLNVVDSKVSNSAEIPFDTKLGSNVADNVANTNVPFRSLEQVANSLSTAEVNIAQNDRDYGNRFKQTFAQIDATGKEITTNLEQTASEIRAEVESTKEILEGNILETKTALEIKDDEISARVEEVNMSLDGKIETTKSEIKTTTDEISLTVSNNKKELQDNIDGVQSNLNKAEETLTSAINQKADDITAEVAAAYVAQDGKSTSEAFGWSLKKDNWSIYKKENDTTTNVLYVDEKGLSVTGNITANSLTIKSGKSIEDALSDTKDEAVSDAAKDATTKADNAKTGAISEIDGRGYKNEAGVVNIIDGKITADYLAAKGIYTNQLEIYSEESEPILLANVNGSRTVTIGGFNVNTNAIYNGTDSMSSNARGVYLGTDGIKLGSNFEVAPSGELKAKAGKLGEFTIGASSAIAIADDPAMATSGIYSAGYIQNFNEIAPIGATGVYLGTDGIKLGENFSIDPTGAITAHQCSFVSGEIGGWKLSPTGLASDSIELRHNSINIGNAQLYSYSTTSNGSYDRLVINGGHSRSGFEIGFKGSSFNSFTVTVAVTKTNNKWVMSATLSPGNITTTHVITVNVQGKTGIWPFISKKTETIDFIFNASAATTAQTAEDKNLTDSFGFLSNHQCGFVFSGPLDVDDSTKYKTSASKNIYESENSSGVTLSFGDIVPKYKELTLGTIDDPWEAIYVKNVYHLPTTAETGLIPTDNFGSGGSIGGGGGGNPGLGTLCFDAGTKITLADGSLKNIEDVTTNDSVISYNTEKNCFETSKVVNTIKAATNKELIVLYFSDGTEVWTTMTHPFYTTEGWTSLKPEYDYNHYEDISDDYFVLMHTGQQFYKLKQNTGDCEIEYSTLKSIKYRHGVSKEHVVYNLDIDNCNTFFANGILGHNIAVKDKNLSFTHTYN